MARSLAVDRLPEGTPEPRFRLTEQELRALAASVLGGDASRADAWFIRPLRSLEGRSPAKMMGTEEGRHAVWRLLTAAEHGVFL